MAGKCGFESQSTQINNLPAYQLAYIPIKMVGAEGFEPPASCSQSKRSSQAELRADKIIQYKIRTRVFRCSREFLTTVFF